MMMNRLRLKKIKSGNKMNSIIVKALLGLPMLFLLLIMMPFVSAQGCCLAPEDGLCSLNSEEQACIDEGGLFFQDPSCGSVDLCEKGCCTLGIENLFTTSRTCEVLSEQFGFEGENNFQLIDEKACTDLATQQDAGACVYEYEFGNRCTYTTKAECTGTFHSGTLCSVDDLGTVCAKTEKTGCYQGNVYYKDSCGNFDARKEVCNFDAGKVCKEEGVDRAICKDVNCGSKKNGEKWCVSTNPDEVGSRYARQYCLNGETYTEPCADFRMETCEGGECQANIWEPCMTEPGTYPALSLSAEGSQSGESIEGKAGGKCDGDVCTMFTAEENWYLDLCQPKIPAAFKFWPDEPGTVSGASSIFGGGISSGGFTEDQEAYCARGNFYTDALFLRVSAKDKITGSTDRKYYCIDGQDGEGACQYFDVDSWKHHPHKVEIKEGIEEALHSRCRAIGDCDGKANIVGKSGTGEGGFLFEVYDEKGSSTLRSFSGYGKFGGVKMSKKLRILDALWTAGWGSVIEGILPSEVDKKRYYGVIQYECGLWSAPSGSGDCGKCGKGDLPCSQYQCKSLGKSCEYKEPAGADKGVCVSSEDISAPQITLSINPQSPVPPFTAIEVNGVTDEDSNCKFSLGTGQESYEEMEYSFGKGYSKEHKTKLYLPGQTKEGFEEISEYDLVTKDGIYDLYVRCEDASGNSNLAPAHIRFEVQKGPDIIPTVIEEFSPESGSAIQYETDYKYIEFEINEPAECRWDKKDQEFEKMDNEFSCDLNESNYGLIFGYDCRGNLTGISQDPAEETEFFIRCKDQPELEGNEDELYQRNVNTRSKSYKLRASDGPLEIVEIVPKGDILKSSSDTSVKLEATTAGGGYNGVSVCTWRLNKSDFAERFEETDSNRHSHVTSNLAEGDYDLDVRCVDNANNVAEDTQEFELDLDNRAPRIARAYNQNGRLNVVTNEEALCSYSSDEKTKCNFAFDEGIEMQGASFEHTVEWVNNQVYYIKCKDYRENLNTGCGIIVKTY
jgi:hypothetical protein